MSTFYGYNNQLWKLLHEFEYTGEDQPFTLQPGKYLMSCQGAQGGTSTTDNYGCINYGGVAYGIMDLQNETTFHAYVGGNGKPCTDSTFGLGGYNGGGNGSIHSISSLSSYNSFGYGGGGATDISLSGGQATPFRRIRIVFTGLIDPNEPYLRFTELHFIDSNGNVVKPYNIQISNSLSEMITPTFFSSERIECICDLDTSHEISPNFITTNLLVIYYDIDTVSDIVGYKIMSAEQNTNLCNPTDWEVSYTTDNTNWTVVDTVVNDTTFVPSTGRTWSTVKTISIPPVNFDRFYTRIMVAGGGGATAHNISSSYDNLVDYAGMGGGSVGGFLSSPVESEYGLYASQTNGASFGMGQNCVIKYPQGNLDEQGSGGGGGGWYGGYATQYTNEIQYGSCAGGGGSSYVLTSQSHKPTGYNPSSEYYFTNPFMCGGDAIDPCVLICKQSNSLNAGDKIIFPSTGQVQEITLPKGTYRLKCYGGDGEPQMHLRQAGDLMINRGGYAEGRLTLSNPTTLFIHVGSSNIGYNLLNSTYSQQLRPTLLFNGGGKPNTSIADVKQRGGCGGDASDIRIDVDDLNHRVIVAGGSGGNKGGNNSYSNSMGGYGGGISGSAPVSGINPGTQNDGYSFGEGGNASDYSGGGGSGWYGGDSGTNSAGAGGSGYVFTENSYKPSGFALTEEYYLTNTTLDNNIRNSLPIGHTKIEIEIIELVAGGILCQDAEGFKYFDNDNQIWTLLDVEELTPEIFAQYGSYDVNDDTGLLNEYNVLCYDPSDSIESLTLDVIPKEQTITTTLETNQIVKGINVDMLCDPSLYNVTYTFSSTEKQLHQHGYFNGRKVVYDTSIEPTHSTITVTFKISKLQETDTPLKIYGFTLDT